MKRIVKFFVYLLLAFISAFLLFLGVVTLDDYSPDAKVSCDLQGKTAALIPEDSIYTIKSWNLGYFGLGSETDFFYDGGKMTMPDEPYYRKCIGAALDFMSRAEKADFYYFQEVDLDSKRSYWDNQAEKMQQLFSGYQSCVAINYKVMYVPVPVRKPQGKVKSGIVTFSGYPSSENTRYSFPTGFAWPVGLFMLDRCFLLTRVPLPSGKDLILINTHNEAFDNGSQRKKQMEILRETMMEEFDKGNYVIVGGDWNLNPLGYDLGGLATGDKAKKIDPAIEPDFLPVNWQWAFDPSVPTNRNVDQHYQKGVTPTTIIDFFVVSPNISVLEVLTLDLGFQWSDHNPIWMKFKLE